jgi:tetratricopeptide (TPR) repeat protein
MDQFLAFSQAMVEASEKDFVAAEASVARGIDVIEMFKLKIMQFQVSITRGSIAREREDYVAMAGHYLDSLDLIEHSVVANELQIAVPRIYAGLAVAQVYTNQLDEAGRSLAAGFRLDPSEPMLWLVKARLQKAQEMPQLALASVNYALAIWKDADADYILANRAKALAAELGSALQ